MQIIENGPLGLRSAVMRLQRRDVAGRYLLFPMVHVGEPSFYAEVANQAAQCDYILIEGVRHPLAKTVSSLFDTVAASPRMRLTVQRAMIPGLRKVKDRIVNIDMPSDQFQMLWRQQPLWTRLLLPTLMKMYFRHLSRFGSRKRLAKGMEMDLMPSRQEILEMGTEFEFTKLIVDRRDEYIIARLDDHLESYRGEPATTAIIFGAGHMRAIIRHLIDRHNFFVAEGRWLTIFGWNLPEIAPEIPPAVDHGPPSASTS